MKKKYLLENLVVLMYSPNVCYTTIVSVNDKDIEGKLKVDTKNETWEYEGKLRKIGESRTCERGCKYGILLVFDRTKLNHLNIMNSVFRSATYPEHTFIYDD